MVRLEGDGGMCVMAPEDTDQYIRQMKPKTPVTILTGFLGAGKTTLLNHILSAKHGMKIGIIENEFGAVSIDDKLLKADQKRTTKMDIIELKNGCLCCSVRKDFIKGLKDLTW